MSCIRTPYRVFLWWISVNTEAEFLDVIGTNVFLLSVHSHFYKRILPLPHLSKSGLKLVCTVNIAYGHLNSENSQDYAQKPQQNCTYMNSASGHCYTTLSRGECKNCLGEFLPYISIKVEHICTARSIDKAAAFSYIYVRVN